MDQRQENRGQGLEKCPFLVICCFEKYYKNQDNNIYLPDMLYSAYRPQYIRRTEAGYRMPLF
jgi:hypothetical protein